MKRASGTTRPGGNRKPSARAARDAEISRLRDIAVEALESQQRFRERELLAAVYALYMRWVKDGHSKGRAQQLIKFFSPKVRRSAHPITVILATAHTTLPMQIRSKWSLALQYANQKNVTPENLSSFMDKNGGMAGCATEFARHKRAKDGTSKKKAKVAPKKR
jgi:hypothetical protein